MLDAIELAKIQLETVLALADSHTELMILLPELAWGLA